MKPQVKITNRSIRPLAVRLVCTGCFCLLILFLSTACSELEKPKTESFYAETVPPAKQEFRWSNGKMPKSFDPALASAPPETDIVRAIYDGLTETDAKTLEPVPAIAEKWTASEDQKVWTFYLRKDAKWSNGERVTAKDFERSWKRLAEMGDRVSHHKLLDNIVGMKVLKKENALHKETPEPEVFLRQSAHAGNQTSFIKQANTNIANVSPKPEIKTPEIVKSIETKNESNTPPEAKKDLKIGIEAVDEFTLKISLINPDKDFPALVAHPIFRPIYGDGKDFEENKLNASIVTNGAFRIASVGQDGVTLDRADHYWDREKIELERVRFVPKETAEKALEAYRAGEIDAVTNADFEPLALKLLAPFEDFQTTTHSALNFYEFNRKNKPYNDRRVREALAISIERERLTEGEMDGATTPALSFLPFGAKDEPKLKQDAERAKNLFSEAGFPNGENFPRIRLVINRNDTQQRIARSVARMWKQNLNIETEIIVKEPEELKTAKENTDFDIIRRGVVLPTTDETANMLAILESEKKTDESNPEKKEAAEKTKNGAKETEKPKTEAAEKSGLSENQLLKDEKAVLEAMEAIEGEMILTEEEAIAEIPAIPLYFPTSYSLVKPYVFGFVINTLDAPSLKDVRIDNNWQLQSTKGES